MLRISKKGDYAVFIMGYLAEHAARRERVISAQEIADRSGLHKSIVANLLKELTKAGLLDSLRGIHGGYRLSLAPEEISLGRILEVVEGPFVLVDCAQHADPAAEHAAAPCSLMSFCPSKRPMQILHDRIARLMRDIRLSDLVRKNPVYAIPSAAITAT